MRAKLLSIIHLLSDPGLDRFDNVRAALDELRELADETPSEKQNGLAEAGTSAQASEAGKPGEAASEVPSPSSAAEDQAAVNHAELTELIGGQNKLLVEIRDLLAEGNKAREGVQAHLAEQIGIMQAH